MSAAPPSLDQLQRWMQAVITHPAGVDAGAGSPAARNAIDVPAADVETIIERSRLCTSLERLAVYGNAYYARLLECLRADYPIVSHATGEEAFDTFCAGYLQEHPPASYTLGNLGRRFPEYLAAHRPARSDDGAHDWADFLIDLAALERVYTEVFDGPGDEETPPLSPDELQAVPLDRWPEARVAPCRSLRLIRLRFPAHLYFDQVRRREEPPPPAAGETWLAVHRRDYVVRRQALSEPEFRLLEALQGGATLVESLERAFREFDVGDKELLPRVSGWFRGWTAAGLIRRIDFTSDSPDSSAELPSR